MNRRNRTAGSLMFLASVSAHLGWTTLDAVTWALLLAQFVAYPQLIYAIARRARNQMAAEMNNLLADAFFFGVWAAAIGFPTWITFIFLVTATVNRTAFLGRRGFIEAIGAMSGGAVLAVAVGGFRFEPETGWPATLISIFTIMIYVLMVAESAYHRARRLHEAREEIRANEQALVRKVEEISALEAQLREQANRDPLTGLYNRRFFGSTLELEAARCQRDRNSLSLVMIDIDHFKSINDTWGHPIGDEVLRLLGSVLRDGVRTSDVACRFGGEEFLVLLPATDAAVAQARAEHWLRTFSAMFVMQGEKRIAATFSAGIATYPGPCGTPDDLIALADAALYRAKNAGRNRIVVDGDTAPLRRDTGAPQQR